MTLLLEEPTAADEQGAQLLFKEARRRRRRLRIVRIGLVTAVVVALVGFGLSFHRSSSSVTRSAGVTSQPGWPRHLRTGATLVYALNDLRVLDADSGSSRVLPLPAPYGGSRDLAMVSIGHSLVLNRGDTAWLYRGSIIRQPSDLGPSDGVFRGPNSDEAWVWSQPCDPIIGCTNYNAPQMGSVHLIDSSGRQIGAAVALPGDVGGTHRSRWKCGHGALSTSVLRRSRQSTGDLESLDRSSRPCVYQCGHLGRRWQHSRLGAGRTLLQYPLLGARTQRADRVSANGATSSGCHRNWRCRDRSRWFHDCHHRGSRWLLSCSLPPGNPLDRHPSRVATVLAGSEQLTNPNLGPMGLTWSTNGWLFSSTVGVTTVHAWRPGQSQARVLPNLRLPKVTYLVNEDPSLIAL